MALLTIKQKLSYGVGHVLNDLCASMWFTYLLTYMHSVMLFDNVMAGNLILLGQIVDALSTPFVGLESDRTDLACRYGKRKTWHLVGTIFVICSFPFLFNACITCSDADDWAKFIYYAPFIVIFQFGWASTQISHLSLIPEMTYDASERVELNAIRNAFTVSANICVFGLAWLLLTLGDRSDLSKLTPKDAPEFRDLVFIIVGLGSLFALTFHIGTREKRHPVSDTPESLTVCTTSIEQSTLVERMSWRCWLKQPQFYIIALLYMSTRLVVNVSQVYMPLYLTETQHLDKDSIATVPLVSYVSGFAASLVMKIVNKKIGRKLTYLVGSLLVLGACVNMWFLELGAEMYAAAVLLGVGGNTMLVTSLAMTADLINRNIESGAFVYGSMSFVDKLSNGIAVITIQKLHPCLNCCVNCYWYYRGVMAFVPSGAVVLALIMLLILLPQQIGRRRIIGRKLRELSPGGKAVVAAGASEPSAVSRGGLTGPSVEVRRPLLDCASDSEAAARRPLLSPTHSSYSTCSD